MESLSKPDKDINDDFDFWALVRSLKDPYLKFCKAFQTRVRMVLAEYRIIAEDEEQSTSAKVKGVILHWKNRQPMAKQTPSELTLELQFVENHKTQYSELSADFASISYAPKTKTALENFKELILLDLKILLGADIPWQRSGKQLPTAALSQADADDDKSGSGGDEPPDAAVAASGKPTPVSTPDTVPPDPTNFLTWTPTNWESVEFDKLSFPADQNPLKSKPYYAVAVLFLNFTALRMKYKTVWDELTSAWTATFGEKLTKESLRSPPSEGPNAFTSPERDWCEQTLRFIDGSGTAAPKSARDDGSGQRSGTRSSTRNTSSPAGDGGMGSGAKADASLSAAAPRTQMAKQKRYVFFGYFHYFIILRFV